MNEKNTKTDKRSTRIFTPEQRKAVGERFRLGKLQARERLAQQLKELQARDEEIKK